MKNKGIYMDIDDVLKRKFKAKIAERDHTVRQVLEKAIKDYVNNNGKPNWMKNEKKEE